MRRAHLPFLLALLPFAWLVARLDFVCDDAFISFRYARNLGAGLGARYNLGTEPPVEGYTDFAWVLWMALVEFFSGAPTFWSRVTSITCGALLLFLVVRTSSERFGTAAAFGAGIFLAVQPTFAVWATGGLGTMPFALSIFLVYDRLFALPTRENASQSSPAGRYQPRAFQAGGFALLTALSRADGLFWVGTILALAFVTALRTHSRALRRAVLVAASITALGVVAQILWRLDYYGDFVPNTARAKVGITALSLERGLKYLLSYWATVPATLAVLGIASVRAVRSGTPAYVRAAVVVASATFAYGVLVGGDFMAMGRFYLPALPFLALLFGEQVTRLSRTSRRLAGASHAAPSLPQIGAVLLAVLCSVPAAFDRHVVPARVREALHFRWSQDYETEYTMWAGMKQRAKEWTLLGRALALHTRPEDTVVLSAIGAAGYYSERFVFDRHGLVSREVARAPEAAPPGRRSPGHDRQVYWNFFADRNPTYTNASLHGPANPPRLSGTRDQPRVIPLSEAQGFPADSVLVLRSAR